MAKQEDFFSGYQEFQKTAYKSAKRGYDPFDGKYEKYLNVTKQKISFEVEKEWLEKFEDAFPYIENCIWESRSFLQKNDELVNIQLANKIDVTGTLNYMTMHTDIIDEYDDLDNYVRPSQLINSYYESTYDIYENRVLFTVINMCDRFIGSMFDSLDKLLSRNYYKVYFNYRKFGRVQDTSDQSVFSISFDKSKEEIEDQDAALPDYARLRQLKDQLRDFYDSQLMKELAKVKEVTAPLSMTNVLQKNANFRKVVELFDYLTAYQGEKVKIINEEIPLDYIEHYEDDFFELTQIKDNLTRYIVDPFTLNHLTKDYRKREIERVKKEKARVEEQKQRIKNFVREAVARQAVKDKEKFGKKIEILEKELEVCRQTANLENQEAVDAFKKFARNEQTEKYLFEAALRRKYVNDVETLKQAHQTDLSVEKERLRAEKDAFLAETNKKLEAAENSFKKELARMNTVHAGEIKKLKLESEKKLRLQKEDYEKKIQDLTTGFEEEKNALIADYSGRIDALNKKYDEDTAALNKKYDEDTAALNRKYDEDTAALNKKYDEDTAALNRKYDEDTAALNRKYDEDTAAMQSKYDTDISAQKNFYEDKISKREVQFKQTQEELKAKHKALVTSLKSDYENRIEEMSLSHKAQLQKVRSALTAELDDTKKDCDRKVQALEEKYSSEAVKAKERYESSLQGKDEKHKKELSAKEALYAAKVDRLNESYRELDRKSKESIRLLTEQEEKKRETLQTEQEKRNSEFEKTIEELKEKNLQQKNEISRLTVKYDRDLTSLKTVHEKEIKRLRREQDREKEKIKRENDALLAEGKKKHEEELSATEDRCQKKISAERGRRNGILERRKKLDEARFGRERSEMKRKLDEIKAGYEELLRQKDEENRAEMLKLSNLKLEEFKRFEEEEKRKREDAAKENRGNRFVVWLKSRFKKCDKSLRRQEESLDKKISDIKEELDRKGVVEADIPSDDSDASENHEES